MAFFHELRVRYQETDMQRHVYFARYLEYADIAMTEYMRHLGWDYEELIESGFDPVIGRLEIEYEQPARFDELVRIEVTPERIGTSSFALAFAIRGPGDRPAARATISYVNFDATTRLTAPIPAAVAAALAQTTSSP
jgi:acyl-CoA thioester hydrolase